MKKLFSPLAIAFALVSTLTGCELYFGDSDGGDDHWTYCANDGYYVCDGDECDWAGARCPDEPGYTCESDRECAAGCYCSDEGVCEEAGFCSRDTDCPSGYTCDEERASCIPEGCAVDTDCDEGEYCSDEGACTASCTCTTDADAQQQGYANCDEVRHTCEPTPTAGSCGGTSTCNIVEPTCAAGEVALIKDECYTGACSAITACDVTPTCEAYQHYNDCFAMTATCRAVSYGTNCTNMAGTACDPSDTTQVCTCTTYTYDHCETRVTGAAASTPAPAGVFYDVFSTN